MSNQTKRRVLAWAGIVVLTLTFIVALVSLIAGNTPLAITMIATNGFLAFMIYFLLRFNTNVEENNPDLIDSDNDSDND